MQKNLFYVILLLASYFLVASVASGVSLLPSGLENPMPVRYPELLSAPAPAWLQEGMRATYYSIVTMSGTEYGRGIDFGTGSTGDGYNQVDVVALEDGLAATLNQAHVPGPNGPLRSQMATGTISPAGCGDFWCSPDVLRKIPESSSDDLVVQRLPVTISGKEYQAIRFDFRNDNFETALVYDQKMGLLLYYTFNYLSYSQDQNEVTGSSGNYGTYEFRDLRKVNIPWKDGKVPSWLAAGGTLSYQGQSVLQLLGSAPSGSIVNIYIDVLSSHDRFAEMRLNVNSQDPTAPKNVGIVSGIAQLIGHFVPKGAIAALRPGVIDTDPDTGIQISVIQNDENGLIFEKTNNQDYSGQFTYDSNGRLVKTYEVYNPDVMTSTGFGSMRVVALQLAE
ncbi:MAG: hypothetical protein ACE14P_04155 [Methanotrichaceae archaeon]